jgi:protein-histidine pros-kinase
MIVGILLEAHVKLLAKFNLVLIVIFAVGMGLIARNAYNFLMEQARQEVLQQAELMSADATATKEYTDQQVTPILKKTPEHNNYFLPQTIPFYAANATFQLLRASRPEYTMREAALNPTNLEDRATEWEAELINDFRNNPSQPERVGDRDTAIGRVLFVAAPIVAETGCLACHSAAAVAPRGLIAHYGSDHGFGWTHNEIIGAQIISVPMSVPIAMARTGFHELLIGLGAVFLLTILLIDLGMYFVVIRPLRRVSRTADSISKGEVMLPPLEVKGRDEIAEVTESFNRMHTSLRKALEMLNG